MDPWPVLRFFLPTPLGQFPQVIREIGVRRPLRTHPSHNIHHGYRVNAVTERGIAGESLRGPVKLFDMG